ncbi:MAG: hypothetical protein ACRELA_08835 [Candidatus Rokuibacteriota bacterium]
MLFADLKGSMELLADRDPEEARKLLSPVHAKSKAANADAVATLVPEPEHLLDASLDHSGCLGEIRPPVSPGHEIDRRRRKSLVTQPVGYL